MMNDFASSALTIHCSGEKLQLHPQRVMYWPAAKVLFAADVHVGKEHVFARAGMAIPAGISESILKQLFTLCDASGTQQLIILGDFVHGTPSTDENWLTTLSTLLDERPELRVRVVTGNHDTEKAQNRVDSRIVWQSDAEVLGPFVLQHAPSEDTRGYVLSGHLHPAWRLSTGRRNSMRTPVFWFRPQHAVLPAFGSFTGGMLIKPEDADRLYMVTDESVLPIPASVSQRSNTGRARSRPDLKT